MRFDLKNAIIIYISVMPTSEPDESSIQKQTPAREHTQTHTHVHSSSTQIKCIYIYVCICVVMHLYINLQLVQQNINRIDASLDGAFLKLVSDFFVLFITVKIVQVSFKKELITKEMLKQSRRVMQPTAELYTSSRTR